MKILETESYSDVLDNGRRRKRPKLATGVNDLSALLATAEVWANIYMFNFFFLLLTLPQKGGVDEFVVSLFVSWL